MEIVHKSGLQDFLKEVQPLVCCSINDTSDTHFARAYFCLCGNGVPGREFQFFVAGYQNFVSDYKGRRDNIEKGIALIQQMAKDLKRRGVGVEEAQVQASGRYPLFEDDRTNKW